MVYYLRYFSVFSGRNGECIYEKTLSMILAVVLMLSALIVPLSFTASAEDPSITIDVTNYVKGSKYDWSYNQNNIFYYGQDVKSTYGVGSAKIVVFEWNVFEKAFVVIGAYQKNTFSGKVIPANGFALTVDINDGTNAESYYALGTGDTLDAVTVGTKAYLYGLDLVNVENGAVSDVKVTFGAPDSTETREPYTLPGQYYPSVTFTSYFGGVNDYSYGVNTLCFHNDDSKDASYRYGAKGYAVLTFDWDFSERCYKVAATYNSELDKGGIPIPANGFVVSIAAKDLVGRDGVVEIPVGTKAYLYGIDLFTAVTGNINATIAFEVPDASLGEPFVYSYADPSKVLKVSGIRNKEVPDWYYGRGGVSVVNSYGDYYQKGYTYSGTSVKVVVFDWDFAEGCYKIVDAFDKTSVKSSGAYIPETGFAYTVDYSAGFDGTAEEGEKLGEGDKVDKFPIGTKAYVYGVDFTAADNTAFDGAEIWLETPKPEATAYEYTDRVIKINSFYAAGDGANFSADGYNSLYYSKTEATNKPYKWGAGKCVVVVADWDYKDGRYEVIASYPDDGSSKKGVYVPSTGICLTVGPEVYRDRLRTADGLIANGTPVYVYGIDMETNAEEVASGLSGVSVSFGKEIAGKEAVVYAGDLVGKGGASILTGEALEKAGAQAMRVYYGYALNADGKVFYDGAYRTITERGVLISVSSKLGDTEMILENADDSTIICLAKNEKLDECWLFDEASNTIIYSNYFERFDTDEKCAQELLFRSYVKFDDGTVIYSVGTDAYSIDALAAAQ